MRERQMKERLGRRNEQRERMRKDKMGDRKMGEMC